MELFEYSVRYDGKDAADHRIDAGQLAESLAGISKIAAVAGTFAATQEMRLQRKNWDVRVLIAANEPACFDVTLALEWMKQHQVLSGSAAALFAVLVPFIVAKSKNNRGEMEKLAEVAKEAIRELGHRDTDTINRMLGTIERMADKLDSSVKRAVHPVGDSCETIQFGRGEHQSTVGLAEKEAILAEDVVVDIERPYLLNITELDLENASVKAHIVDDAGEVSARRVRCLITDPSLNSIPNPYVSALQSQIPLRVKAKATLKDGVISVLYVSDAERDDEG